MLFLQVGQYAERQYILLTEVQNISTNF